MRYCCCCQVTSVVSDSVWPHRQQCTRLLCLWDSPGKNTVTGVGCHFLLQCMKVESESEVAQSCPTLSDLMDCRLPGSSVHGIFQARVLEWVAIAFSMMRYYYIPIWKAEIKKTNTDNIKCWQGLRATRTPHTLLVRMKNGPATPENDLAVSHTLTM